MKKKIVLLANYEPGYEICKFLSSQENLLRLYVPKIESDWTQKIIDVSGLTKDNIFFTDKVEINSHVSDLKKMDIDYMLTVYWPWILKPEVFNCSKHGCLNFHPALLPINRGWYPHVFSIIDGTPTGVTLHFIDEHTDTGPIIAQKIVPIKPTDTAKAIYDREKYEIISLFKEKWDDIRNNKLTPIPQDQSKAVHHSIKEVHALDEINLEKQYKARDLINLLRARSFGNRGFAYYELDGEKIYLNLRLSYQNKF